MSRARWATTVARAVLVAGALTALACSTEEARLVENGSTVPDAPNSPNEPFRMGDTIQIGDYRLVVHDVVDPFVGASDDTRPRRGDRWVGVDATLTNLDDEAVEVSAWALFELEDSTLQSYRVIDPEDGTPSITGEIPAGGSRRGTIVFEVAGEANGFKLFFAGDVFSSGSVTVELT